MIPKNFSSGDVKMEVRTGKIKIGPIRYIPGVGMGRKEFTSWATTKTRIYFHDREQKSYDGHLFVDGNRLMIRKAKKFLKPHWAYYLKDVEITKFDKNVQEECAIVFVSHGPKHDRTRRVLFVQSNNNEKSYDLVAGKWVDHPFERCATHAEWAKKFCTDSSGKYMC